MPTGLVSVAGVVGERADLLQQRTALIQRSDELRNGQPGDHAARRLVFNEIRRANQQMLKLDPWRASELGQRAETLEQRHALIVEALRTRDIATARIAMLNEINETHGTIIERVIQKEGAFWQLDSQGSE